MKYLICNLGGLLNEDKGLDVIPACKFILKLFTSDWGKPYVKTQPQLQYPHVTSSRNK
jgi:hypothetical protein